VTTPPSFRYPVGAPLSMVVVIFFTYLQNSVRDNDGEAVLTDWDVVAR
jgi:hypothetical protein